MVWAMALMHMTRGNRHLSLPVCLIVGDIVCITISCRLCLHGRLSVQRSLRGYARRWLKSVKTQSVLDPCLCDGSKWSIIYSTVKPLQAKQAGTGTLQSSVCRLQPHLVKIVVKDAHPRVQLPQPLQREPASQFWLADAYIGLRWRPMSSIRI